MPIAHRIYRVLANPNKVVSWLGLAKTIHTYVYTVYIRKFSREITIHTVIYGVHVRFWPTLIMARV